MTSKLALAAFLLLAQHPALAQDQRAILEELYRSTSGPTLWGTRLRWMSGAEICSWHGVGCFEGNVNSLDLTNNTVRHCTREQLPRGTVLC